MKQSTPIAKLTVHNAEQLSPSLKKEIADWLRRQADDLLKDGDSYSKRFTARFMSTKAF